MVDTRLVLLVEKRMHDALYSVAEKDRVSLAELVRRMLDRELAKRQRIDARRARRRGQVEQSNLSNAAVAAGKGGELTT